jgi:hypothetical protein
MEDIRKELKILLVQTNRDENRQNQINYFDRNEYERIPNQKEILGRSVQQKEDHIEVGIGVIACTMKTVQLFFTSIAPERREPDAELL